MRKAITIIVLSIYATLAIGMQLHLHYCCGELADSSFFASHETPEKQDPCSNTCVEKVCCTFDVLDFRIHDEHRTSFFQTPLIVKPDQFVKLDFSVEQLVDKADVPGQTFVLDSGPDIPIYIKLHSLVLYA